jgi:hypothetical protein
MAINLGIEAADSSIAGAAGRIAWDVYLAHRPGPALIDRPAFWMHQLRTDRAPRLDADVWAAEIARLLTTG